MHVDPLLPILLAIAFSIILLGMLLKKIRQPHVVAYLLVGVLLGPHGLAIITDQITINHLGSIGLLLLLFFIGMEISPKRLVSNWKLALIGTLFQIIASVSFIYIFGYFFDWSLARIILLGFVISLSSTAVVIKLLQGWGEVNTTVGQDTLGILLVQDLAIVPMIICIGMLSGDVISFEQIALQSIGGGAIIFLAWWATIKGEIRLPWLKALGNDSEMQLFSAMGICFGLALLTGLLHLSTAFGAFVAGIVVSSAKEVEWVHRSLHSLYILFIALFFLSIGMLIDLDFFKEHLFKILIFVLVVMVLNFLINVTAMKMFSRRWPDAFYAGALLSQIGEFSFVLAAIGLNSGIIDMHSYKETIIIISLSLLISPIFIVSAKYFLNYKQRA